MITATKEPKTCRGFNGVHHPIFTGFRYKKLRRGKNLCDECCDKMKAESEDNKFWRLLINRVK